MAIDFMIMPLSRYISGDYITPIMRWSWEQGVPYAVYGAEGRQDLPPNQPFGGPDAPAHRESIMGMLREDLRKLPLDVMNNLWDERSSETPRFHRVEPKSYELLLQEASGADRLRGSVAHFFQSRHTHRRHLLATLYLPCLFGNPFKISSPFNRVTGSVSAAIAELESGAWSQPAISARDTLHAALRDASDLRLPMIVDF
jgi:hypothetical protein